MPAVLAITCLVFVGVAVWLSSRVKHPENLSARSHAAGPSASDQLYLGSDRPAGPDAEDPPTATPNRSVTFPPPVEPDRAERRDPASSSGPASPTGPPSSSGPAPTR